MLTLSATTDAIEVVLATAHTTTALKCVSSWRDITTTTFTPGRTVIDTNGTTPIDAVTGPAASTQRVIDMLSIHNTDSRSHQVTVSFDANGTEYKLRRVALGAGQRLEYTDRLGWKTYDRYGAVLERTVAETVMEAPASGTWSAVLLDHDVVCDVTTASTLVNLTELALPVIADRKLVFRYTIMFDSSSSSNGSAWTMFTTAKWTNWMWRRQFSTGAGSVSLIYGYDNDGVSSGAGFSTNSAATEANHCTIIGYINPLTDGIMFPRFGSELAGPTNYITAKKGSLLEYMAV